ncbi:MAG: hypothetical protein JWN74_581 [Acidobacteriaceae bacterium]|nr:hypothetical protein [Acidobacteriaceae bacterium]
MEPKKGDSLPELTDTAMRLQLISLLLGCSIVCQADTTVKTGTTITDSRATPNVQNPTVTHTVYYQRGAMRRKDSLGASMSSIANCDTKTGFLIDLDAHQYRTYKVVKFAPMLQLQEYLEKNPRSKVQVESQTVDTGERKTFFGHPARHLITTTKRARDEKNNGGEETIDGWYIDHEGLDNDCAPDYVHTEPFYVLGTGLVIYPEIPQFHHIGPIPGGLAVKLTHRIKSAGAKNDTADRVVTLERTVEEISDSPLNSFIFELPSGLHENPQLLRGHSASGK